MELRQLEYFHAVAKYCSFTGAAEKLHMSQPTITTAIKNLEEELGSHLFVRTKRAVMLTYAGQQFLEKTAPLLDGLHEAAIEIQELSSHQERILNIGITPVAGSFLIAQLYADFKRTYPELQLQVLELGSYAVLEALQQDEIDLGYMVLVEDVIEQCEMKRIQKGEIVAILHENHPLARKERLSISDFMNEPIVCLPPHAYARRKMDELYASVGAKMKIAALPQQMFSLFNLVERQIGISFILGNEHITSSMLSRHLVAIPLEPSISYECGFVWKKGKHLNKASKRCIQYFTPSR